jgi:hypothetical protein
MLNTENNNHPFFTISISFEIRINLQNPIIYTFNLEFTQDNQK